MTETSDERSLSIAILTARRTSYSVKRLIELGRKRGHRVRAFDPEGFSILLARDNPTLFYRGKPLPHYDAVIPRIAAAGAQFGAAVVRQFEQMGVFCANSSTSIFASRDKFRATQIMTKRGIGLPATAFVTQPDAVEGAVDHIGGAPVVVKLIEGSQGIGVTLAENRETAKALVDMLHAVNGHVLMQAFVAESKGRDIRAFVVDGQVVASMRRIAATADEFRSNLHRGGHAESIELDEVYQQAAVRAAQVIGLRVAGVDILEGADGPMVIEVNSSPGLEGIETASGKDVAGAIFDFVERECHLPEFDIRQRLTMAHGHSIVELRVAAKSKLADKAIRDSALGVANVRVLTATRGDEVIPLPPSDFVVSAGDSLVAFGPADLLRALAPRRGRRKRDRK